MSTSLPTSIAYRQAVEADAVGMAAVHTGRVERDQVDPYSTLEDIIPAEMLGAWLRRAQIMDGLDRWLVAETGGQITGYSSAHAWREDDGTWVYLIQGWVLPEWRGLGIGSELLGRMEALSRKLAAEEHPGEKAEFAANASSTEIDSTHLLLEAGYRAGYTVLEMDLDPAAKIPLHPLPEGIEVRPVLPEHLRWIAESVVESYRHEYDQGRFAEDIDLDWYTHRLGESNQDPGLWQVAWAGEEIAGQVLCLIEKGRAEVFEVSVRPAYRRQGLARALLSRALRELRRRDEWVVRLHTVAEFKTRARDLYTSVGFRVLKEFPRYRKAMVG